jgi:hypothetical protein
MQSTKYLNSAVGVEGLFYYFSRAPFGNLMHLRAKFSSTPDVIELKQVAKAKAVYEAVF